MAMSAATREPGPAGAAYGPDSSLRTPILTTPSVIWACAVVATRLDAIRSPATTDSEHGSQVVARGKITLVSAPPPRRATVLSGSAPDSVRASDCQSGRGSSLRRAPASADLHEFLQAPQTGRVPLALVAIAPVRIGHLAHVDVAA